METREIHFKLKSVKIRKIETKSKYLTYLLIALSLLFFLPGKNLWAGLADPDIPVKGTVIDSVSGEGISYVTIQIENNGNVVQRLASDESGKFSFTLNTAGNYNILLHSVGYQMKKTKFVPKQSGTGFDLGKITLTPSNEQVKEVTVSALKPLVRSEAEKLIYNVESDPESTTSNALDMLRKVPMVSVDGEDNVKLRGISGVKFLINGKTSSMLDQNAKEVLRSMPSNTIKDIEVITNPSSKYEAEGSAGIINIVTTRKTPDGFNGRLNAGLTSRESYNGNIYFASKIHKFIYSVNLALNHWNSEDVYNKSSRETYISTSNRYSEKKWYGDNSSNWNTLNTEASYEIDSLNLVSFSVVGRLGEFNQTGHTEVNDFDINHSPSMGFQNWFNSGGNYNFLSGNVDYQKLFRKEGNVLTISYRHEYSPGDRRSDNNVLGTVNFAGYHQKISSDMMNNEGTLQIDYVNEIDKKHQIETGYKQIWRTSNTTSDYLIFDEEQNKWIQDITRINDLDYKQSVMGIYLIYDLKLEKTELKIGLRGENTVNHGFLKSVEDTTFANRMFNLVPYLLFSKNFEKDRSLKLSFTQRLGRPWIGLLNPFRNDADPQNIRTGNPNLETEVTNNLDFSFNKFTQKNNFGINLNGSFSNNLIVNDVSIQPNGVKFYTFSNSGENRYVSANIFGSSKLTKKLNINATLGSNYTSIRSNTEENDKTSGWNFSGNVDLVYKITGNTTFLAGGGDNSGYIWFQYKGSSYHWYYLTCQQDILKKKVKLEARFDSRFNKYYRGKSETFNKDFFESSRGRNYARIITLRFSYNFGTMKDQVKKSKTSIRNDDLKQGG